jgi:uroporphyrinogen decarboxylase
MNSRERVLASINHNEPDRIPIDLGGTPVTGINAIAYDNLKKQLLIRTGQTRVYDVAQQLAQ